ncbi:MAG TPA: EAL domain-containing protein [Clostridia bacterium]|nr:EAL domain-containing protein [Clostridia bacterium]
MSAPVPLESPSPDEGFPIRRRIALLVLLQFAVVIGVVTFQGLWPGGAIDRPFALALLVLVTVGLPVILALLAAPIIRRFDALERELQHVVELYGRARSDALLDGLTELGNHRAFQEELARQLVHAERHATPLCLLLIDVDDLKRVNDERGHASGDDLLVAVGRLALTVLRRSDRAFRVGGDEFAILLPQALVEDGLVVARRMLSGAVGGGDPSQPIDPFSLSIGVSAYPNPSTEKHQLYRDADAALYWGKRHGRTTVVGYDPGKHASIADERSIPELAAAVGSIIAEDGLRPAYQPIFSLTTGEVVGFEGLVGPVDASRFPNASALFAGAEAADRTVELDMACLASIARGVGALPDQAYLSVNISPRTLESEEFQPSELRAIFGRRGISPSQLVLELTERQEVTDLVQLRRNVAACRSAGMRIAADDVGAGNAGLRLLSEIQFDVVKIDLSLVQGGILHDPDHAVLRALQELAARWNASVVAEGVETPAQLEVVRDLGIRAGQGYLLSRPRADVRALRIDPDALIASGAATDEGEEAA